MSASSLSPDELLQSAWRETSWNEDQRRSALDQALAQGAVLGGLALNSESPYGLADSAFSSICLFRSPGLLKSALPFCDPALFPKDAFCLCLSLLASQGEAEKLSLMCSFFKRCFSDAAYATDAAGYAASPETLGLLFGPLWDACLSNQEPCARILLDEGAPVSDPCAQKRPALLACIEGLSAGCAHLLLLRGAPADFSSVGLDAACALRALCSFAPEPFILELAPLLHEKGAGALSGDPSREPLRKTAERGLCQASLMLIDMGANPFGALREDGADVFDFAADYGHADLLEALLARFPERLNEHALGSMTPLLWRAAKTLSISACQALMELGANPRQKGPDGKLPEEAARERKDLSNSLAAFREKTELLGALARINSSKNSKSGSKEKSRRL